MRIFSIFLATSLLVGGAMNALSTEKPEITLEQIRTMFANIKAQTKWDLNGSLLWGYYFIDPDTKKLQAAADELVQGGYRLVDIHQAKDKPTFILHVERIEHHTPESLNQRNQELYALAEKHQLTSYDGMDVGPAE